MPIGSTDRLKNKCIISSIIWRDCPWRRHSGKRSILRGLLVEIVIKDGHFMGQSPKRRKSEKKRRKK